MSLILSTGIPEISTGVIAVGTAAIGMLVLTALGFGIWALVSRVLAR
jgi:hypothetical protein